jgi:uncharacterized protein (TIGR00251 family)
LPGRLLTGQDAAMTGKPGPGDVFDVVGEPSEDDQAEIVVRVHVQPGAGRTAVVGRYGDALKLKVGAPPEGGRANEAVATLLATTLGVKRDAVNLTSGASSRTKRFRIGPVDVDESRRLLAEAVSSGTSGNAGGRRGVR